MVDIFLLWIVRGCPKALQNTLLFCIKNKFSSSKNWSRQIRFDKLAPVPVDLSKLSDVAKNDVIKKTDYDKLVAKVNSIDTRRFVLKSKYDTDN